MQDVVEKSEMKKVRENVFASSSGAYLIDDISKVRAEFDGRVQRLNTREMKLETLGIFPLEKASLILLTKTTEYEGQKLTIPPLLTKSQIPIYAGGSGKVAYIPPEGANICRYFYELWALPADDTEAEITSHETVVAGFTILASYAGI